MSACPWSAGTAPNPAEREEPDCARAAPASPPSPLPRRAAAVTCRGRRLLGRFRACARRHVVLAMAAPEERGAGGAAEEAFLTFYSEVPAAGRRQRRGRESGRALQSSVCPLTARRGLTGGAGAWRAERSLRGGGRRRRGGARAGERCGRVGL